MNIFLQVPEGDGGEPVVYRRMWTPELEDYRDGPDAYWYVPEAVAGVERAILKPCAGDLVIFNSRHVHAVQPVAARAPKRLTLSVFGGLSLEDDGILLFS